MSSYFLTRISVLQTAVDNQNTKRSMHSAMCWICLDRPPNKTVLPCDHRFCQECLTKVKATTLSQVPVNLSMLLNDPNNTEEVVEIDQTISPNCCPLCRCQMTRVADYVPDTAIRDIQSLLTKVLENFK